MAGRLFDAVTGTRFAEVKLLLDLHVNVDCKNILGQTPLFVTLQIDDEGKRDKMFRYLVRRGAEVLEEDYRQKTLFQYTCELGRVKQATRILDQVGAGSVNLNGRDLDGNTALLYAVKSKNIEIVKMLVEMLRFYHMTVDLVDNDGCTPLIHAKKLGLSEISDILLRDGRANAHIADNISRFNAYEWEEHTKERLKREARDEKEKQKVQNLIFPKVGQVQAKKKANFRSDGMKSCPSLSTFRDDQTLMTQDTSSSTNGTVITSSRSMYSYQSRQPYTVRRGSMSMTKLPMLTDKSIMNKSVDSAISLLEIASRQTMPLHHVDHFVSSQFDKTKASQYQGYQPANQMIMINNLMTVYSEQHTGGFRKVAKIVKPKTPPQALRKNKKVSTLAILFGRDKQQARMQRLASRKQLKRGKDEKDDNNKKSKKTKQNKKKADAEKGAKYGGTLAIISEDTEETLSKGNRRSRGPTFPGQQVIPPISVSEKN